MNTIEVLLEPEDYLSAQRLHSRWTVRRLGLLLGAGAAGALLIAIFGVRYYWIFLFGCALIGGAAGGLIGREVARRFILPRRAKRVFAQQKNLQRPVHFEWDASGLAWKSVTTEGRTPWSDYVKWRQNDRVVLLYHSDVMSRCCRSALLRMTRFYNPCFPASGMWRRPDPSRIAPRIRQKNDGDSPTTIE